MTSLSKDKLEYSNRGVNGDVSDFCIKNGIANYVEIAAALARDTFSSVIKLETRLQDDPDTDQQSMRVVIDVTVDENAAKTVAEKKDFTRQWIQRAPPEAREKIRLLYHFA